MGSGSMVVVTFQAISFGSSLARGTVELGSGADTVEDEAKLACPSAEDGAPAGAAQVHDDMRIAQRTEVRSLFISKSATYAACPSSVHRFSFYRPCSDARR